MPDPVIRRLSCAAVLYLEEAPDGLSLARLVIDIPLPDPSVIVANLPEHFDQDPPEDEWPPSPLVEAVAAVHLATSPLGVGMGEPASEAA